jgi:uncharacterized protein YjdB
MAICEDGKGLLTGVGVVLEVADGCPDTEPTEEKWQALGALTSKGFDFSPNMVTSSADDGKGYVESMATNSDFSLPVEGEVRQNDKLDQYGIGKFIAYYNAEMQARRNPTIWVRVDYGPVILQGYMVISALSSSGGTPDIVTFSTEFKIADSDTFKIVEKKSIEVESITVTPTSGSVAAGATTTFTVNFVPANAANKTITVVSADTDKATVANAGSLVTVSGVAAGTSVITVTTANNKTATYTATVTS